VHLADPLASPDPHVVTTRDELRGLHRAIDRRGVDRFEGDPRQPFKSLVKTKLWTVVQSYPSGARFPDGETLWETQTRALEDIERLRLAHPKDKICCVSHADVIKLIAAHYLGMHIDLFQRIDISPGSITVISVGDYGPRVHAVNTIPTQEAGR
jgi:broad specificity phosphatase PhoE